MTLFTAASASLLFLTLFSQSAMGQHSLTLSAGIHSKQASGVSAGLSYQYKFSESFGIKSSYFDVDNIDLESEGNQPTYLDYQHWLIGGEFLHQQANWHLAIGGGIDYIAKSSHNSLVDNEISPYLSFSASYPLSDHWLVSIEQYFHFNSEQLGNYQVFQLGIQYQFGEQPSKRLSQESRTTVTQDGSSSQIIGKQTVAPPTTLPVLHSAQVQVVSAACWIIQWGVFVSQDNASSVYQQVSSRDIEVNLYQDGNVVRVISQCYETKEAAIADNISFNKDYNVQGFVRLRPN